MQQESDSNQLAILMRYLIYAPAQSEQDVLQEAPVQEADKRYLQAIVQQAMKPLSDDEYMHSLSVLLQTFARSSYIQDGHSLYWCVEWDPGLLVIKFSPGEAISWAAVRSPIPEFGGRVPLQADIDAYDDEAKNHQYNLVFSAWDAQFSEQEREWLAFIPATENTITAQENALEHANQLGRQLEARYSSTQQQWASACKANIALMAGEGARIQVDAA